MNIYVSANAANGGCGTQESPFSSLIEAKDSIRKLISEGLRESVTVHVASGKYRVGSLEFTEADSGTASFPISYIADGCVTLNGGVELPWDKFRPVSNSVRDILHDRARDKVICFDLSELGIGRADYGEMCAIGSHNSAFLYTGAVTSPMWCELFINDERQTIARYPNEGFLKLCGSIREGEGWNAYTHADIPHDDWVKMRDPIADVYKIDEKTAKRASAWKYKKDLWMFGYPSHDWADMSTPVVKIDENQCSMEAKYVSMFGVLPESKRDDYHNGGNYYLYNVLDELDAPGEWYLDRDNAILYLYPDKDISQAETILSLSQTPILCFSGAHHMSFSGFTLVGTRADGICGTCNDVTLSDLLIKNVAGNAISLEGYRNTVRGCEITATGKGGIRFCGGERTALVHGDNLAENNYIHDFSKIYKTYQSGIHLLGCGNIARNNEICNTPHQAIGYAGNEHLIEYNYIHDAVLRSSDAGAIYSGFDWAAHGTVIRYNLIENIGADGYRSDGIYWDDGLSGQTAYGNILVNVLKFSLQLGGGHDNVFKNNLIINSGDAALKFDDRYRNAYFTKGQFYSAIEHCGASRSHFTKLELMPYRSELWAKKYPNLAKIKTSPNTDPDDPDYPINPSYCSVTGNAVVAPRGKMYRIFDGAYKYSVIENNYEYDSIASAGIDGETYSPAQDSAIFNDIPDFSRIPVEKIGRRR